MGHFAIAPLIQLGMGSLALALPASFLSLIPVRSVTRMQCMYRRCSLACAKLGGLEYTINVVSAMRAVLLAQDQQLVIVLHALLLVN
jgi:hypothetical protein